MSTDKLQSDVLAGPNAASAHGKVVSTGAVLFAKSLLAGDKKRTFHTSTTTSTATETKVDSCLLSNCRTTHAVNQTKRHNSRIHIPHHLASSIPRSSQRSPPPDLVGKETKIQVQFAHFDRVILRNNEKRADVDKAALALTKTWQFKKSLKRYVDAVVTINELDDHNRDPSAAEVALMELVNHIVSSAPGFGLKSPYRHDLFYLKEFDHFASQLPSGSTGPSASHNRSATPQGLNSSRLNDVSAAGEDERPLGPPPRCIGVIKAQSDNVEYIWDDVVVAFKVDPIINHPEDGPSSSASKNRSGIKRKASTELPRPAKKWRKSASSVGSQSSPSHLQPDGAPASSPDAALTGYAVEMLRVLGNRRHALTVHVTGLGVRFLYYDRAGCVFSTKLNLVADVAKFAAAFINLSLCNAASLGLEPNLESSTPTTSSLILLKDCRLSVNGFNFAPDNLIHSTTSLYGRGTTVYRAKVIRSPADPPSGEHSIPDVVVVKMSWQMLSQGSEDELYRIAARHGVEGVPTLYCSRVGGRLSEGIRGKLVDGGSYVDRELRIQVMGPVCIPLYRVTDLDEFKQAFISLVKAHHDLYEKAGILHRDVSINNLMVDPENRSRGILIDLDIAVRLKDGGTPIPDVMLPHAGTIPFRSLDLLDEERPTRAYYRHDLESFLYALVWILGHYDRGRKIKRPRPMFLDWHSGDWASVRGSKAGFLGICSMRYYNTVWYPPLQRTWLPDLAELFDDGYSAKRQARKSPSVPFDDEMLGGFVTFDNFMNVLLK